MPYLSMQELADHEQIYDSDGKTVLKTGILSHSQVVIVFTDKTYLCLSSRINEGKPWISNAINAGAIEKEWRA